MARTLGSVAVGEIVKLNENGVPTEFYVAKHDYESGLNGAGRTLLVRADTYPQGGYWNISGANTYAGSTIDAWFNETYKALLDSWVQTAIDATTFYYTPGNGTYTVATLTRAVFAVSVKELGLSASYANSEGTVLPIAYTLRNSETSWTRTVYKDGSASAYMINSSGNVQGNSVTGTSLYRPSFTLPSTLYVDDNGSVFQNTSPSAPSSISVPNTAFDEGSVTVSWSAGSDKEGNLVGYTLMREFNNDNLWRQIYRGSELTYTDSDLPGGTTSVRYRVRSFDSGGLESDWTTSSAVKVIKKAPSSITAPMIVMQGQPISITWDSVSDADSYVLQRKADAGGWEQVYAGSDTSYTDTAGNWSTVQYQVCGVFDGTNGAFAVSEVVTVAPASTLVISGQDSDLGTITADIPYSVVTDTGKQIVLTRTVNGALVESRTVNSGFAYSIPVMDLPTGTGTIVITATVQTDSDPVTVTRTWTYTKAAQTFPPSGGVAQLQQDGQNVFPLTLAEAVKAIGGPWGGNLSTALDKLAMAAVYNRTRTPKYTEVKVDLSKTKAGDIVNLPENGVMVPFYVASLDYEPTLNTGGTRVLLVRKDVYQSGKWNESNVNTYSESTIDTWFNTTYKSMLDSKVLAEIGETAFYYTPGNSNNEVTTLERAVFALSLNELGITSQYSNKEGSTLAISAQLQIAYIQNNPVGQFTRTPQNTNVTGVNVLTQTGAWANAISGSSVHGYRPCFTLPATFSATFYVNQNGTVHADQEYAQGGSFADLWGNIIPTVKIETGSYVGTGTSGSSSPNMLTFQFEPKMLFIAANDDRTAYNATACIVCAAKNFTVMYPFNSASSWAGGHCSVNLSGNSVSWWMTAEYGSSDPQDIQFNRSGFTYHYVALG